ncbi:MAG: single-stranded DNA-binding protein [Cyclobacteriaceae bacterium]
MSKADKKTSEKTNEPETKTEETQEQTATQLFADINVSMKSGHLTKDPEIVGDGKYAKLRIASNKQYLNADSEIKTNTNYFDVLISSNLKEAFELACTFKKGDWAYVKGEDSTKSFETPEGYKKTACTIFAYHAALKKAKSESQILEASKQANQAEPING